MKHIHALILAVLSLLTAACGSDDTFMVNAEIEGLGTRNMRFYYYDGRALQTGMAAALDGKFTYHGRTKSPAIFTIATAQRDVIGHIIVRNGDAIDLKLNSSDPTRMEVKGNKDAQQYAEFLKENAVALTAGNPAKLNEAVEKYVTSNRGRLAATAALLLHYDFRLDPAMADSLLGMIDEKARPVPFVTGYRSMLERAAMETEAEPVAPLTLFCDDDSLTTVSPSDAARTLMVFTDGPSARLDSVNAAIDAVAPEKNDSRRAVLNIALDRDTTHWKQGLKAAPSRGRNLWAPGSVSSARISRLGITRLPAFIVVDSLGNKLYQGTSVTRAVKTFTTE